MRDVFFIRCAIERGGFSSERTFEIDQGEDGKIVGTADVEHFFDADRNPLGDDEPGFGEVLQGFVKCRIIRHISENEVLLDLPGSEVIHVPFGELLPMQMAD